MLKRCVVLDAVGEVRAHPDIALDIALGWIKLVEGWACVLAGAITNLKGPTKHWAAGGDGDVCGVEIKGQSIGFRPLLGSGPQL